MSTNGTDERPYHRRHVYFDADTLALATALASRGGGSLSHVVRQAIWRHAEAKGIALPTADTHTAHMGHTEPPET